MRLRFAIVCGLVTAAAVAALAFPAAVAVAHGEREGQFVELQQEAADAAALSSPGELRLPAEVRDDDPRKAAKLRGDDEHRYGLYDSTGARTMGEGPASLEPALAAALEGHTRSTRAGGEIAVAIPLSGQGTALRASEPAAEADGTVRSAVLRLVGSALLLVLLAPVIAWFVAARLVRPLQDVASAANRIGDGDVTVVAPRAGIREIDDVADALNASADRIDALIRRERQLSADTAHQLRTPLAGLRLTLEGEHASPGGNPAHIVEEALGAVHRLQQTVDDLATLARGETPAARVDLRSACDDAAARWGHHLRRADRTMTIAGPVTWAPRVRRSALDTVLDVLIENALRHGDGDLQARVGTDGDAVFVALGDAGRCDLSEEELFTRQSSGAGGTGIGLDLGRSLAMAEGGDLRLTHRDPTRFTLTLPAGSATTPAFNEL